MLMMRRAIIGIVVSLSLMVPASADTTDSADATEKPQFKENIKPLGVRPEGFKIIQDSIRYGPDMRHVSYVVAKGKTRNIIQWDERTSPVYYAVRPEFPKFSAEGRHAYIAYKGKKSKASVVVDWELIDKYDNACDFRFSPDGKRYVYRAAKGGKQSLIIDGEPDKWYTGIPMNDEDNILFSPDSRHIAYVVYDGKACKVVQDGKEQKHYFQLIKDLKFSPDSKKLAYKGRVKKEGPREKWCVVVNGEKHEVYYKIFDLRFSPNSKHLAYTAFKDKGKMVLVLDGKEVDTHKQYGLPVFSPDSQKLAYSFMEGKEFHVVINSDKGPGFPKVYKFYYSPDSSRYAYIAGEKGHWQCVVDGEAERAYQSVEAFKFSPDSSRYAYGAVTDKGGKIVVDGTPHQTHLSVGEPYFSPDSKHTVYRARPKNVRRWITIFDGEKRGEYYPGIAEYFFSKDSNHLAYNAILEFDKNLMIVDGKKYCEEEKFNIVDDPYFSPDSNYVAYIAGHGKEGEYFLIVNDHVLPTTYNGFFKDTPLVFDDATHFHTIGMRETDTGPEFLQIDIEIPENIKLETDLSDL